MPVKPIPDGYHTITPYLVVANVNKLIEFVIKAFDAKEKHRTARPDGTIMHAEFKIGDSPVMMAEAMPGWPAKPSAYYLYVTDTDAVYQRALQAGGKSIMEPANQFYGDRNAGVEDPVGNQWFIATHIEDMAPEELQRRAHEAIKQREAAAKK
jgi:PhnB protein